MIDYTYRGVKGKFNGTHSELAEYLARQDRARARSKTIVEITPKEIKSGRPLPTGHRRAWGEW